MIERADKKKNIDKVAASIAKNPLQTARELGKDTWIGASTANRAKKEVAQNGTKDDRIVNLTNKDFELMQKIQVRKFERMEDKEKPINDNDINNWDKEAKVRYSLFRWEVTDTQWWLKDNSAIDNLNNLLWLE